MKNIQKLKEQIKIKAQTIRESRARLKEEQRNPTSSYKAGIMQVGLLNLKRDYRHHHIAYCELRGLTRDRIETPKDNNLPSESVIANIKQQYAWTPEEIEAYNARKNQNENVHNHS